MGVADEADFAALPLPDGGTYNELIAERPASRMVEYCGAHRGLMASALPTNEESGRQGLLLVGHGSREAVGVEEFLLVARQVAAART